MARLIRPFTFVNGKLFCENVEIDSLFNNLNSKPPVQVQIPGRGTTSCNIPATPAYVYSLAGIRENVRVYVDGLKAADLCGKIGYAIKANPSIHLVEQMRSFGVEMIIAVSGYEVMAAMQAGFEPGNILLNGNGKQAWEVKLSIEQGVMMNVDSVFDAQQIAQIHKDIGSEKEVKLLLRIRPRHPRNEEAKLKVHDYINTAENSKFGFEFSELPQILQALNSREQIKIIGVHCHFGSCLDNPKIYEWLGDTISTIIEELRRSNISIKILNVGGGIGIDYHEIPPGFLEYVREHQDPTIAASYEEIASRQEVTPGVPTISTFMSALATTIPKNIEIIVEPGRSLVGNAGILVSKTLGKKTTDKTRYLVVDGSMNEVIRPCLYGSYHGIFPTMINSQEKWEETIVAGPICESADFLGKNVPMQMGSKYIAVMNCGAYCASMSSNYNLRPRVAEILVDNDKWSNIREREDFTDLISKYPSNY